MCAGACVSAWVSVRVLNGPVGQDLVLLTGVTGLVLYVEHMDTFPQALSLESPDPFLGVSKQGPCLTAIEEDGGDKRLVQLELASEGGCVASGSV